MGYILEINSLLKLPSSINITNLKEGEVLIIEKEGERLFPLHKPVEFCDGNYQYIGKLRVDVLTLKENKTILEVTILKIFTQKEQEVFSNAYIK